MIRQAVTSDCQWIADIYNQYLGKSTMDTEPKLAKFSSTFLSAKNEREELWVIEADKRVIGWGIIKFYSPKKGYQFAGETSVFLDVNFLDRGYGTQLKEHLIERCRDLEYHHLLARIFADNEVSIAYNQKLGYRIVGRQNEIGNINGEWKDVVIMELLL